MGGAIKYNLTHLLDFSGRDARQTFWFYVLFLFLVNMAIGLVVMVPFMAELISTVVAAAQTGDQVAVETAMADQMGKMMASMLWVGVVTTALNALLLAAAFTRRLHDSSLSGWWGLLPLGLQAAATWYTSSRIDELTVLVAQTMQRTTDPQAAMMAQSQMSSQSLIGWLPIIALAILGTRKSTVGPNRYAEEPVSF